MMSFDPKLTREAVRLFEGRSLSQADADKLHRQFESREDLLEEFFFRRGLENRFPELAAAIERSQRGAAFPGGRNEQALYESLLARIDPATPTAIYVPRWRGVATSTRILFTQTIPIPATATTHPDDIDERQILAYAEIVVMSGVRHFVVSGGDRFHLRLIESVLQQDPGIRFDLLWHSNYLQMGESHDWDLLRSWLHAIEMGRVFRVGVLKQGFDKFLRNFGCDAVFIPNYVPANSISRADIVTDVVGIWLSGSSSYRKLPHAMIAAVKAMPSFFLKGAGLGPEGMELVSALDVPFLQVHAEPISYEQLLRELPSTAVGLYVTSSECSPMLPLESFACGVPCLVGPSSHLFRDHEFLRRMLVVEQPYNPGLIAEMATAVVAQRPEVLSAYAKYLEAEEARATDGITRLLA